MAASGNVGMISWNRRVLQARANLNGGELDERLPSNDIKKGRKDGSTPPDRPKWRRAGCSALRNGGELERIESTRERRHRRPPYTRFRPEVFRVLTTFRGILLPDP